MYTSHNTTNILNCVETGSGFFHWSVSSKQYFYWRSLISNNNTSVPSSSALPTWSSRQAVPYPTIWWAWKRSKGTHPPPWTSNTPWWNDTVFKYCCVRSCLSRCRCRFTTCSDNSFVYNDDSHGEPFSSFHPVNWRGGSNRNPPTEPRSPPRHAQWCTETTKDQKSCRRRNPSRQLGSQSLGLRASLTRWGAKVERNRERRKCRKQTSRYLRRRGQSRRCKLICVGCGPICIICAVYSYRH